MLVNIKITYFIEYECRADLTGHSQFSQSANFCQKGWDGHALLGQPSKGRPCRISILFPQCSITFLAPHIKKLATYIALLYFWTFAQCVQNLIPKLHECKNKKIRTLCCTLLRRCCFGLETRVIIKIESHPWYLPHKHFTDLNGDEIVFLNFGHFSTKNTKKAFLATK